MKNSHYEKVSNGISIGEITKFSRPIMGVYRFNGSNGSPENTSFRLLSIQCVEQWGRFGREKSKDPPFEKPGKSPKTKGHDQVARRLSKFDTRLAEVRWKTMEERFHCRSSTAADRRSKISSPFMRLAPLATPLKPPVENTSRLHHVGLRT